jgi:hypothetical protein
VDLAAAFQFFKMPKPRCAVCGHEVTEIEVVQVQGWGVHDKFRVTARCHGAEEVVELGEDFLRALAGGGRVAMGDAFATETRVSVDKPPPARHLLPEHDPPPARARQPGAPAARRRRR